MAFDATRLRPIGRNSTSGNVVWLYHQTDTRDEMSAPGYFPETGSGLAVGDIIFGSASDGPTVIRIAGFTGGFADTESTAIGADDIPVGEILPAIGGSDASTLQEALERIHSRLNLKAQRAANVGTGTAIFSGSDTVDPTTKILNFRRLKAGSGIILSVDGEDIVISSDGTGSGGGGGGGGGGDPDDFPPSLFGGSFAPWAIPAAAIETHPNNSTLLPQFFDMVEKVNINSDEFAPAFYDLRDATTTANLQISQPGFGNLSSADKVPWNPSLFQTPTDSDRFVVLIDFATGLCYEFWQPNYNSGSNTVIATSGNIIRQGIEGNSPGFANVLTKVNAYRPVRGCGIHHAVGPVLRREIDAGEIPHCMTIVWPKPAALKFEAPAIRGIGLSQNQGGPERGYMGLRIVWDGITDQEIEDWLLTLNSSIRGPLRIIAECARTYGFMGTDGGGNFDAKIGATQLENRRSGNWQDFNMNNGTTLTALHGLLLPNVNKARILDVPTHVGGDQSKTCCYVGVNYPFGHPCFSGPPPGSGGGGGGGGSSPNIPPIPADLGFNDGLRRLHVHPTRAAPLDGATVNATFTTIQAALNAAQAGDCITVAAGTYRERPSRSNLAGTVANPVWLVAEERGKVILSDTIAAADNGTAGAWVNEGGGVFSRAGSDTYIGSHNDDFLMRYNSEADLRAGTVNGVVKPQYGLAFQSGRVYVRLRGNVNPNGQKVKIPQTTGRSLLTLTNCDNMIVDGFVFEGAGQGRGVSTDSGCSNFTIRNCTSRLAKFLAVCQNATIMEWCDYGYTGFGKWAREIRQLNGADSMGTFTLVKEYYTTGGNAHLEGGINNHGSTPNSNVIVQRCLIGPCFDGARGDVLDSEFRENVFFQCIDDGIQCERSTTNSNGDGIEVHDNRFVDCFFSVSHQEALLTGTQHVYRNVMDVEDTVLMHPAGHLKMIKTNAAAQIFYYHNLIRNLTGLGNDGFGVNKWVWFDFANGTASTIRRFFNNVIIYPDRLDNGAGPNPVIVENNVLVAPSANGNFTGTNGVYAGDDESDMRLASDYALTSASPAVGAGRSLPGGLPDSRDDNTDAGPFPLGVTPGNDWPRPRTQTFDLNPPSRWPF